MKSTTIILLFLIISTSQSQWQKSGIAERIKVNNTEIKDFVISDDSKYIYTLDNTGEIKKWDNITGDSISSISNKQDIRYPKTGNWIFLSSDGKTYCTAYSNLNYQTIEGCSFYIFNLINNQLIDSLYFKTTGSIACCKPEFTITDFDSMNKKIIYGFNYNQTDCNTGKWGGFGGETQLKIKNDTNWITKMMVEGGIDYIFSNKNQTLFFLNPTTSSWSTTGGQGYRSDGTTKYTFCNTNSGKINVFSQYSRSSDNGSSSSSGIEYNYKSGIFLDKYYKLLLSEKNRIFTYSLDNTPYFEVDTLNEFPSNQDIVLSNTIDDNLFYIIEGDSFNIYNIDNFICLKKIEIDDIDLIKKTRNSKDKTYLFLSDNKGYIYRIPYDDFFKLEAGFKANKTVVSQFDSVKFYNLSLGLPDSFFWDFGDGTTSMEEKPVHIFSDTGFFNIKLVIGKNGNYDTLIKNNYIKILPYLKADFDYTLSGEYPIKLAIINKSLGNIDSLVWLIDDSTRSKELNPVFELYQTKVYSIKMTIFCGESQSSLTKEVDIKVIPPPLNNNKFSYVRGNKSLNVKNR